MDVHKEPVGDDDQSLDVMIEQHLQIPFEAVSLVVGIGEYLHV